MPSVDRGTQATTGWGPAQSAQVWWGVRVVMGLFATKHVRAKIDGQAAQSHWEMRQRKAEDPGLRL